MNRSETEFTEELGIYKREEDKFYSQGSRFTTFKSLLCLSKPFSCFCIFIYFC
jgi:hypothetical protein